MAEVIPREIEFTRDRVTLAGSIWIRPRVPPDALFLMYPGSGPSDRNNDGYFVPLRNALVDAGFAVAAFDKRGAGRSTGRWQDAGIETQASDLLAALAVLDGEPDLKRLPVGLFGHSQGGWVVLEAASREPEIAFVIINSGPGVTPAAQERYSAKTEVERSGASGDEVDKAVADYETMNELARAGAPFHEMRGSPEVDRFLPADGEAWKFWMAILDYDPKQALRRIKAPILALFGGDDVIVPVEESVAVFREVVPPTRLSVEVFTGADHRLQVGEPPMLAPGYVETVFEFLAEHLQFQS